jgi:hypothetical protein
MFQLLLVLLVLAGGVCVGAYCPEVASRFDAQSLLITTPGTVKVTLAIAVMAVTDVRTSIAPGRLVALI